MELADLHPEELGYPRALLIALVGVAILAVVIGASTSGTAFGAYNVRWDGASELRSVAESAGTDSSLILNTTEYPTQNASGTVAVVLSPDRDYGPNDRQRIRQFVRAGGTLIVAEDFGNHSNPLLGAVGASARVNGTILRDERYYYRTAAMPRVNNVSVSATNRSLANGTDENTSYVANVSQLTFNHGTVVEPGNATVLVRSSQFAYLDSNRNASIDENETMASYPVVTVESVGAGQVVTVSDPSLFINAMLDQPDNGNFTANLFASHERVLLDYSHAASLPPLAVLLVVLRKAPLLQAMVTTGALVVVVAWGQGRFGALVARIRPEDGNPEPGLDAAALAAYFERQHPEWDQERVERVTEGVIRRRSQERGDD